MAKPADSECNLVRATKWKTVLRCCLQLSPVVSSCLQSVSSLSPVFLLPPAYLPLVIWQAAGRPASIPDANEDRCSAQFWPGCLALLVPSCLFVPARLPRHSHFTHLPAPSGRPKRAAQLGLQCSFPFWWLLFCPVIAFRTLVRLFQLPSQLPALLCWASMCHAVTRPCRFQADSPLVPLLSSTTYLLPSRHPLRRPLN